MAKKKRVAVASSDIQVVQKTIKTRAKKKFSGTGSSPVGGIVPLGGKTILFTGEDNDAEKALNAKIAIKKSKRPAIDVVTCDAPNCRSGPNNNAFIGVAGLFTELPYGMYCNGCLQRRLGGSR